MSMSSTRRQFLARSGAAMAGLAGGVDLLASTASAVELANQADAGDPSLQQPIRPRVAIARDEILTRGRLTQHRDLLVKMLNASIQRVADTPTATEAWRLLFKPSDRVGIKVNTLGLSTQPAVVDAIVAGLRLADVPAENVVIWDRFDVELAQAGFTLNKSGRGVQCRGTDGDAAGSGYQATIESSGEIGSSFSRIVAEQVDALICVPVLKDHNLAGASLGMKNFYGAIHNPNKYHDHNCDPYIVDVVSHRFIRPKWKLTVCDATRAQYHAGPARHPGFAWPLGGLIVGTDFVAADAVATDLLESQRKTKGLKSLDEDKRPTKYIATAGARGLGVCDLRKIERIEV